jgi:ubiquitin carboxyl-terminal hydrolase 1
VLTAQSEGRTNSLLYSREHQDAQELFQLLSECIKNEIAAVDKEGYRDRGLGGLRKTEEESNREIGKSVFDGLTANRRSCITCGYTEAVMHFAFDNWQLSVPRMAVSGLSVVQGDKLTSYVSLRQVVLWSGV